MKNTCLKCINPAAVVCADREPAFIEVLCRADTEQYADDIQTALNNAICYAGHEECSRRKENEKRVFKLGEEIIEGKKAYCPICQLQLKVAMSSRTVVGQCPVHGVVVQGLIKNTEQE